MFMNEKNVNIVYVNNTGVTEDVFDDGAIRKVLLDGSIVWTKNGNFHRDNDLPAKVLSSGVKEWWVSGKRHRDAKDEKGLTLPAIERPNGTKEWFKQHQRHRDDKDENGLTLPAVISEMKIKVQKGGKSFYKTFVSKQWWANDKLHRDDKATGVPSIDGNVDFDLLISESAKKFDDTFVKGATLPAIIFFDPNKKFELKLIWYKNGKKHRDDKVSCFVEKSISFDGKNGVQLLTLPAVINGTQRREWWQNGLNHRGDKNEVGYLKYVEFIEIAKNNLKKWKMLECESLKDVGDKVEHASLIFKDDDLTAPMIKEIDALMNECGFFQKNDLLPAVETSNSLEWFKGGVRHRDNFPAVLRSADLGLKGTFWRKSIKEWYTDGKLNRNFGEPAIISKEFLLNGEVNVFKQWFVNGAQHRIDGPSLTKEGEVADEECKGFDNDVWFINGTQVCKEEHPWWKSQQEKLVLEKEFSQQELESQRTSASEHLDQDVFGTKNTDNSCQVPSQKVKRHL